MTDLSVRIGTLHLANPVLTASGTFGYGSEFADFMDLNRLGGLVTKTVTLEARPGNPPPRICETPAGMLNSIGLPNVGIDRFIAEKWPFLSTLNTPIIVNVAGRSIADFVAAVTALEAVPGIAAYELNYSCPNVKEGGLAFSSDARVAAEVTRQIRAVTRRPLIAKLTPNVTSISEIGRACEQAGADAVSAINTLVGMAIDIRSRKPRLASVTGGLSGPAIKPVALARVYELVRTLSIPVIGIGGIISAADALEFIIAGAAAVQIGTASFMHPGAAIEVVEGLEIWCRQEGITTLAELRGSLRL
ncbi:MAG TPA: dihydroorotate dehydrogenase [bacterium]|nr:dihydroorotate dehydrogenase [bacterium]HPR86785.1 dihydroorotate dehydrogenase [bacterium]